jgi:hypothetical protein
MTAENPEAQIQTEPAVDPALSAGKFDKGFTRNIKIVGIAFLAALLGIGYVIYTVRATAESKPQPAQATIPLSNVSSGTTPLAGDELTPAEVDRIKRVQTAQADEASKQGQTYIPRDIPLSLARPQEGPGPGYQVMTGDFQGGAVSQVAVDPQRQQDIKKGVELQIKAILDRHEAPPTSTAGAYQPRQQQAAQASATSSTGADAARSSSSSPDSVASAQPGKVIVSALTLAGVKLASSIDTSRGDFASAEIETGPLAGAYMIGEAKLVPGESGLTITFKRMNWRGKYYAINATALDPATSADPVGADIDRKLLQRHVLPIIFESAQAYATALARPSQTVVISNGQATVASPAAVTREAAAAAAAAGFRKIAESASQVKASAFLPANHALPILFLDSVADKL